jgi:hypothetical protein
MTATLYSHTQPGTLLRVILGISALVPLGLFFVPATQAPVPVRIGMALTAVVLVVCAILFHSLSVTVDSERILISFGPGLVRKSYPTDNVVSCQVVRNSIGHGWGIHYCGKDGWVYNVSGFDAVEIVMKDGRKARIGTDAPQELAAVVNEWIRARGNA